MENACDIACVVHGFTSEVHECFFGDTDGTEDSLLKFLYHHYDLVLGFNYETEAAGEDILAGRQQNTIMPWGNTIRFQDHMEQVKALLNILESDHLNEPFDPRSCFTTAAFNSLWSIISGEAMDIEVI